MPEGPSIVILKEILAPFEGKKVLDVGGSTKAFDTGLLKNKTVSFKTWGNISSSVSPNSYFCIHFLLFGSLPGE